MRHKLAKWFPACVPLDWPIVHHRFLTPSTPNRTHSSRAQAAMTRAQVEESDHLIEELMGSIARYKDEYAVLITEVNQLKNDMVHVETKLARSKALLTSLAAEQQRWTKERETFQARMSTLVGDALLSGAFLAYSGYLDQQHRASLLAQWSAMLATNGIESREGFAPAEYLSSADERMAWQKHGLPADQLCVENAIILSRFNRYPVIIDPSGDATEFILSMYADKQVCYSPLSPSTRVRVGLSICRSETCPANTNTHTTFRWRARRSSTTPSARTSRRPFGSALPCWCVFALRECYRAVTCF